MSCPAISPWICFERAGKRTSLEGAAKTDILPRCPLSFVSPLARTREKVKRTRSRFDVSPAAGAVGDTLCCSELCQNGWLLRVCDGQKGPLSVASVGESCAGSCGKGGGFGGEVGLSQTPLATKQPKTTKELVCEMVALLVVVVSPSFVISAAFTSCGFDLDLPTPENPFRRRLCFPSAAHFPLSP